MQLILVLDENTTESDAVRSRFTLSFTSGLSGAVPGLFQSLYLSNIAAFNHAVSTSCFMKIVVIEPTDLAFRERLDLGGELLTVTPLSGVQMFHLTPGCRGMISFQLDRMAV